MTSSDTVIVPVQEQSIERAKEKVLSAQEAVITILPEELSEFHNRDYENNAGIKPYVALKSNIYYFSLCFFLFKKLTYI